MNAGMRLRILGAGLALSTLALGVQTAPVAAQQGGIEGTVTDQATVSEDVRKEQIDTDIDQNRTSR